MVINRKRLIETASVVIPFLTGIVVGKFGLKDKKEDPKKEEPAKTEEKKENKDEAKAKG